MLFTRGLLWFYCACVKGDGMMRGQGGQLARDSAGIVNKQVKGNRLEPGNALSSLAVICPPGIWGSSQDYWSLGFLSPS